MANEVFSGEYPSIALQNAVEKEYWYTNLRSMEGSRFKRDRKGADRIRDIRQIEVSFDRSQSVKAIRACRQSDDKLYALLAAVLAVLLHKYNGDNKLLIASGVPSTEESPYGNSWLPLVATIPDGSTFKDILLHVTSTLSQVLMHQNFPIEYVVNDLYSEYQVLNPFNDVEVLLKNIHSECSNESNVSLRFLREDDELTAVIKYNASLYEEATILRISEDYTKLFCAVLNNATIPLIDIAVETYKFSCAIIGESSIAVRCAEILLDGEHDILTLITNDEVITPAAKKMGLQVTRYESQSQLSSLLKAKQFDYLFSINNPVILSPEVLSLPRKHSINYHDSLLPAYAGRNATAWAIINKEKNHGITWHCVSASVDSGDILAQTALTIEDGDTAFSLNMKCYRAALAAFAKLVPAIQAGTAQAVPQPDGLRKYFGKYDKPFAAGVISFQDAALDINAHVRACNFGTGYDNAFASAKIIVERKAFFPRSCRVLDSPSKLSPGMLAFVNHTTLCISTATNDIELSDFIDVNGDRPRFDELNLTLGMSLSVPTQRLSAIDLFSRIISKKEAFWRRELSQYSPLDFSTIVPKPAELYAPVSANLSQRMISFNDLTISPDNVLLLFGAFLLRLSATESMTLMYQDDDLSDSSREDYESLFAQAVPLNLSLKSTWHKHDFLADAQQRLARVREAITFPTDIFLRYSRLPRPSSQRVDVILTDKPLEQFRPLENVMSLVMNPATMKGVISGPQSEALADQFNSFLENLNKAEHIPLNHIQILSSDQQAKILHGFNKTAHASDTRRTLHQLLEDSVLRHGEKTAIAFHEDQLTYKELNVKANQLAYRLQKDGAGTSSPIAVVAARSCEMIIAILGILKAGAAYVPIDSELPLNRMRSILDAVNVSHVITFSLDREIKIGLQSGIPSLKFLYELETIDTSGELTDNLKPSSGPDDVAYVIHTSGSTGAPKGVVVQHHAAINTIQWVNDRFNVSCNDTLLFITSVSFDLSVYDIFGMISAGGTLRIVEAEVIRQPALLALYIAKYDITFWNSTPGTLQQVTYFLDEENVKKQECKLRLIFLSGDWIPMSLIPKLKSLFSATIVGLGGATEASIWSNYFVINEVGANWMSIPYGTPINNAQYFIFDRHMNICPIGVEGDLYISGDCLSLGYLNQVELTANRFVINPYEPSRLVYKTGDRARFFGDGNVEFLGRIDRQVKIRGFRVELNEVENAISKFPGIKHVIVLARVYADSDKRLIAYFVSDRQISGEMLRRFVIENLPEYMVPAKFINVEEMPLTSVGKIDFAALESMTKSHDDEECSDDLPSTDLEKRIAAIWEKILDHQKIKLTDNFFDLGGHSFLVIKVSLQLKEEFGKEPRFIDFNLPLAEFVSNYSKEISHTS